MPGAPQTDEFRAGVAAMLPIALAALPFGMIFGVEALRQGLTMPEAVLMSLAVFAGGSQFLAMGLWADPVPWAAIATATLIVNLRHVLMAASLQGKMGAFGGLGRFGAVFFLADETWALAERRALQQPLRPAFYWGVALTLYLLWAFSTGLGTFLGAIIADPVALGLDFAFPALFLCLVTGFVSSWHSLPVIATAAVMAWAVAQALPGTTWYVMAGGLAGVAMAAITPARAR